MSIVAKEKLKIKSDSLPFGIVMQAKLPFCAFLFKTKCFCLDK